MTGIYLVRHGEADYDAIQRRRWPGKLADLAPLTPLGFEQANAAGEQLAGVGAAKLLSSPFTRTMQTASAVSCRVGLAIDVELDLHEWLPDDTFSWHDVADVRALVADFDSCGGEWPPGERRVWEPLSSVRRRAAATLRRAADSVAGQGSLIAVCHEMVIRSVTGVVKTRYGQVRYIDSTELPVGMR
ncbi:MAG TPA: histidine phosphatase family protein [Streptosporangiaceae bacterium]|nr:histidine phosphatase family protein [Streptosporangiaceae bacterium]